MEADYNLNDYCFVKVNPEKVFTGNVLKVAMHERFELPTDGLEER
jgi:hypothetical protein